jgi:protein SCO1/2
MECARGHRDRKWHAAAAALIALALAVAASPAGAGSRPSYIGATIENPQTLPDFALRDQSGRLVSLRSERGRLVLLTFLYVECHDVCPLVAGNVNTALKRLGPERKNVRVLAISVDPIGDTRKAVRRFVSSHRLVPEFHYLVGTRAQLRPVWQAYDVVSIRRKAGDVDHTLYTLLVDRDGKGRVLYDATALPGEIAHDLRLFLD